MESAGTSSSDDKERMEAKISAANMIAQGKRNLVCGEVPAAVNQFQDACKTLSKSYGETAKECAEAYFCYGQALLDLARMETGVLGNALEGVPEDEDESSEKSSQDDQFEKPENVDGEEREKLRAEVYDAMAEADAPKKVEEKKEGEQAGDAKKDEKAEGEKAGDENKDEKAEDGKKDEKSEDGKKGEKGDGTKDEKKEESMETETANEADKISKNKDEKTEGEKKMDKDKDTKEKDVDMKEGDKKDESAKEEGEEEEEEGEEGEEGDEEGEEEGTADEAVGEKSQDEEGKEKKEGEEDPDDVSNLQLAWEMLELAKLIYSKEEDKESKIKMAESHLKLGEVSLETEQYERAVDDFNECLKIQKSVLEPEDRLIAETHYQLGLAHCFNKQYDQSIEHYRTAIKVIEEKIAKLTKLIAEGDKGERDPSKFDDPITLAEKEIKELKEILPDMKGKIEDTEEEKKNLDDLKNMAKEVAGGFVSTDKPVEQTTEQSDKKASDISHLIRRKRKPEEEEEAETDAKKTRQENASGDASANGEKGVDSSAAKTDVEMKKVEAEVTQQPGAVAS